MKSYLNEIKHSIAGTYDFKENIEVFLAPHGRNSEQIYLTRVHETAHRRMCSCTCFGILQSILAYASNVAASKDVPQVILQSGDMLDLLIAKSWYTHEGFAVYRQKLEKVLHNLRCGDLSLPEEYEAAYSWMYKIEQRVPDSIKPFQSLIIQNFVEAALNTRILKFLLFEKLTKDELQAHLEDPGNCPDQRLIMLVEGFTTVGFSHGACENLLDGFRAIVQKHNLVFQEPLEDFLKKIRTTAEIEYLIMQDEILELTTSVVGSELPKICPRLSLISQEAAENVFFPYHAQARTLLQKYDINIPEHKNAALKERIFKMAETEYVGQIRFLELPGFGMDAERLTDRILEENGVFILQVGKMPLQTDARNVSGLQMLYYIYVYIAEPVGESSLISEELGVGQALRVHHVRFWLQGDWEFVKRLIVRFQDRSWQLLLEETMIDKNVWAPIPEGQEIMDMLKVKPFTRLMSMRGSAVLENFRTWQRLCVEEICLVHVEKHVVYILVKFPNQLRVLFKCVTSLLGMIKVFEKELWAWFEARLVSESVLKKEAAVGIQIPGIVLLDEMGAFDDPQNVIVNPPTRDAT